MRTRRSVMSLLAAGLALALGRPAQADGCEGGNCGAYGLVPSRQCFRPHGMPAEDLGETCDPGAMRVLLDKDRGGAVGTVYHDLDCCLYQLPCPEACRGR